ncbi:xylanase deacetylase [Cohnella kolymensis]|uniref:Xylanase deacetylase n=1 Tax=Cohnella kolymensis TaxID=1590652 RepID=A0ABR5A1C5_9BACL|nr:xylanase deacetylase [Cohnella kolymensis]
MNRLCTAAAAAVLALNLTACGNSATPGSASSSTPEHSASPPSSEAASSTPSAPVSSSPPASAPTETTPALSPEPAAAAKSYRMNKVYRIVPIDKAKNASKVVLLTFDDGPKDKLTLTLLLDTLDKHNAKAIFFVNGYRVKAHPELLKEIDNRKQVIGNHSWDHINLKKEKPAKIKQQLESVQTIVKEVTGKTPVFFRPPFGSANASVHQIAKDNSMLFMTWSNGSLDWDLGRKVKDSDKPKAVIKNVMEQLHDGSNILMHELPWTAAAMDELLTALENKGYSFVDPNSIDLEL